MFDKAYKKPLTKGLFIFKNIIWIFIAFCGFLFFALNANAQTKSLKLYYVHTGEKAEIIFKKNGKYVDSGLKKLNYFLRDWRRNEPTKMDPRLFDLVWQVYQNSGSRDYIHVISGYRSPATNNMLRSRSAKSGVAKNSQHTLGRAMDFYLPDVNLSTLRKIGLKQEVGGVGYYPTSGSPFVHMDVGSVRHWPRMSRSELLALFPDGKTIHIPSDGKPLTHYNQALAEYKARRGSPAQSVIVRNEGNSTGLFARLFGGKKDTAQQQTTVVASRAQETRPQRQQTTQPQRPQIIPLEADQDAIDDMFDLPDSNDAPIPAISPMYNHDTSDIKSTPVANAPSDTKFDADQNDIISLIAQNNAVPIPSFKPSENISVAQVTEQLPVNTKGDEIKNDEKQEKINKSSDMLLAYNIPVPVMRNPYFEIMKSDDETTARMTKASSDVSKLIVEQNKTQNDTMAHTDDIHKVINDNNELIPIPEQDIDRDITVASITPSNNQIVDALLTTQNNALLSKKNNNSSEANKEILKIPTLVIASSIKKGTAKAGFAKLTGRAIDFQAIAHISR